MTHSPSVLAVLFVGTAVLATGCIGAPPMNAQETQIQTDLAVDKYMPATRQMRDAIETQELFAQAAFWSNEYNLNPADLESALKLSAAVRKLGNPGRAVEITQTTRALYPRDPYLMSHALSGDPATAEGWLRRAVSMPNASDNVRQNLILVLKLQGKMEEAQRLSGMTRQPLSFPKTRPAFNPAPTPQQRSATTSQPRQQYSEPQAPQARMFTGPAEGQNFSSASEAARAMAAKQQPSQTAVPPQPQNFYRQQPQQPAPQSVPQGYPPLAGSPTPPQPERRQPNRRRR